LRNVELKHCIKYKTMLYASLFPNSLHGKILCKHGLPLLHCLLTIINLLKKFKPHGFKGILLQVVSYKNYLNPRCKN